MGSWQNALDGAQEVLNDDKRNIKSIYVKAESLFNMCEFEHSLVLFHRGLVSKLLSFLVILSKVCIYRRFSWRCRVSLNSRCPKGINKGSLTEYQFYLQDKSIYVENVT